MPRPAPDTRARILAAAADEFARHGFAGANVDRIARRARANKAMIYYHFASKAILYRQILRDIFDRLLAGVRQATRGRAAPLAKLDAFVDAVAREADRQPHFAPIWLRELAEGGRHLDPETFRRLVGIPATLAGLIREGRDAGFFHDVDPLLAHFTIVGPLIAYFASAPARARFRAVAPIRIAEQDIDTLIAHVQGTARAMMTRAAPAPTRELAARHDRRRRATAKEARA